MKIGIDVGGSHIAVGLVNEKGKIIKKTEKDLKQKENIKEDIVNYVDNSIHELSKNADITKIGIAAPGNPNGAKIYHIVNLGIEELDFSIIEQKYGIRIKSINDAKAAGLAEKQYGAMYGYKDEVFLCLGTGIGGAVFLNNQLLQANKNSGFELGHIVIEKDGIQCNCGKKGCFETYCSIKRFKENISKELNKINYHLEIENSANLIQEIEKYKQESNIQKLINQYINDLIIGLSNIIDIFEPEIIVLGGSFVYFKEIIYTKLLEEMEKRKYVFNKNSLPKIELAQLGNDAGIIGATLI